MVLNIILWGLIALIGILLLILFIPFRLAVSGNIKWIGQQKSGSTQIQFGGLNHGISVSPFPSIHIGVGHFDHPLFSFFLPKNNKTLIQKSKPTISYLRIGKATIRKIQFDHFFLYGDLGLPNPMHTGLIYGWSQILGGLIKSKKLDITINPQFNNQFETDMKGHLRLKFFPGKVLWQAMKTYFKFRR